MEYRENNCTLCVTKMCYIDQTCYHENVTKNCIKMCPIEKICVSLKMSRNMITKNMLNVSPWLKYVCHKKCHENTGF